MCPVILWLLLGSVFKAHLGHLAEAFWRTILFSKFTLGMSRKIKKKKSSHQERRARAKAKVKKFRHQALSVALVVCCRHRPSNKSNKPPTCMHQESISSEPVHWKWKKREVGLNSVISRLRSSTLDSFCAAGHDFLRLPQ
jgi:hypothetical protein